MSSDENILEEMLDRATDPKNEAVDELGLQMFYMVIRNNSHLIQKALELILTKIRSSNTTESLKAIALLEESMSKCGGLLQEEVAKYRFLNNLTMLVSSKHDGVTTPAVVKKRIMESLLLWTTKFPEKAKISQVYGVLKNECDVDYGDSPAVIPKNKSVLDINEPLFATLINLGDAESLRRANFLVKYSVGNDMRRTELNLQYRKKVEEVSNTTELLNQLLSAHEDNQRKSDEDDLDLMRELYASCKEHKTAMQRLLEVTEDIHKDLIGESFMENEKLQAVLKRYKLCVKYPSARMNNRSTHDVVVKNADLLADLLGDFSANKESGEAVTSENGINVDFTTEHDAIEDWNKFLVDNKAKAESVKSVDLLKASSVAEDDTNRSASPDDDKQTTPVFFGLKDIIDELSVELSGQNQPVVNKLANFRKETERPTLNDLAKEKVIKQSENQTAECNEIPAVKRNNVSSSEPSSAEGPVVNVLKDEEEDSSAPVAATSPSPLVRLSDITIDLDDITPNSIEDVLLDDDDIKVTLNFTENRPSRYVSVIVVSVVNKSKSPVKDFQFEASAKKPCKVRLLPPTATTLPPHKPFRPLTPINQVMLLLNPTTKVVDVTCIVGYTLGDDPDPIKESIVAKGIPFVE